mmetsp:Transcript_49855/g.126754  ORF Transcript_49855/g.126754 Transcript_49855/m.126754 type:complete len:212 (+) Transcript_49855:1260-1895(+)
MPWASTTKALFCFVISSTLSTSLMVLVGGQVKTSSRDFMTSFTDMLNVAHGAFMPGIEQSFKDVANGVFMPGIRQSFWLLGVEESAHVSGRIKACTMSRADSTPHKWPASSSTNTWWQAQLPARAFDTMRSAISERGVDGLTVSRLIAKSEARAIPLSNHASSRLVTGAPSKKARMTSFSVKRPTTMPSPSATAAAVLPEACSAEAASPKS